jgi:hypothetical protein
MSTPARITQSVSTGSAHDRARFILKRRIDTGVTRFFFG